MKPKDQSKNEFNSGLSQSPCPACGYQLSMTFFEGGNQPLATLGWPDSKVVAQKMEKLPLDFVRCLNCGHVYNRSFQYQNVPYIKNPNLMYNKSPMWQAHMKKISQLVLSYLPDLPTILEIGCGEGQLLQLMANLHPQGKYIGFDPNTSFEWANEQIQLHQAYFEPAQDLPRFKPQVIITRHVLEHLMNPLAFLLNLAFFASHYELTLWIFIEVPCIDKAIQHQRLEDFYYEHNSHFTSQSFRYLLEQVSEHIEFIETSYGDEVIYGLAKLKSMHVPLKMAHQSIHFQNTSKKLQEKVETALEELAQKSTKTAIWGGTGKSAAFINFFKARLEDFPLVVDSDAAKWGTHVPGTGQLIQDKMVLIKDPVDTILITTQWRAKDIVKEIKNAKIPYQQILLEFNGELVNFETDEHPY